MEIVVQYRGILSGPREPSVCSQMVQPSPSSPHWLLVRRFKRPSSSAWTSVCLYSRSSNTQGPSGCFFFFFLAAENPLCWKIKTIFLSVNLRWPEIPEVNTLYLSPRCSPDLKNLDLHFRSQPRVSPPLNPSVCSSYVHLMTRWDTGAQSSGNIQCSVENFLEFFLGQKHLL